MSPISESPKRDDAPLVASLVLNYGSAKLAGRAVASLRAARYPRHEILLVDNGSPDAGAAAGVARDLEVPALLLERNLGFGGGMNRAAAEAERRWSPDYFFLLNDDARVEADAIDHLVRTAREHAAAMVAPKILIDAPEGEAAASPPVLWSTGGVLRPRRFSANDRGYGERDLGQYDSTEDRPFLSACALLVRAADWRRLGGFEERFFMYLEDWDFCIRAGRLGLRMTYEPAARVHHLGSVTGGDQYGPLKSFYRWRNRLLLFDRHAQGLQRAALFLGFFPCLVARDLYEYARRGRWSEAARAFAGVSDLLRGGRGEWW